MGEQLAMLFLRLFISAILLGFPIVALAIWALKYSVPERRRENLKAILAALCAGMLASIWGALIAMSIPEYPTKATFFSTILQMDIHEVVTAITHFWSGADAKTSVHPLVPVLFQPVAYGISLLTGLESELRVAQLTSVLSLSVSTSLLFWTVFSYTGKWMVATSVTIGYVTSFGFLLFTGFPESAGLASYSTVLPYAICATYRSEKLSRLEKILYIFAGTISFGVTLTNLIHAIAVYWTRYRRSQPKVSKWAALKSTVSFLFSVLLVASLLSVLQARVLYKGAEYWFLPGGIASQGAWLALWWDGWLHPVRVIAQVMLYSVLAPNLRLADIGFKIEGSPLLQISAEASKLSEMPVSTIVVMMGFSLVLLTAFARAYQMEYSLPAFIALLFHIVLHTIYGNDLLLYAGYWLPLIWLLIALGTSSLRQTYVLNALVIVIIYHNYWGWMATKERLENVSTYAMLQISSGLPLEHEFRRTLIDWSGTFSPGIGSNGVLLITYDLDEKVSNLTSLSEHYNVSYSVNNGSPTIVSQAGNILIEQSWYPLKDGVLTSLRLRARDRAQEPVRARVYLFITPEGPAGSDFPRNYSWREDNNVIYADSVPFIRCITPPAFVLYHEKPHRLFEIAITGSTQAPRTLKNVLRAIKGEDSKSRQSILLCWELTNPAGKDTVLWFHCLYSLPLLDGRGIELYKSVNLPRYHPVQGAYKPLSARQAEELRQLSSRFWSDIQNRYYILLPDKEWSTGFWGATGHLIQSVQRDGRIPVTPINYGVFVRNAAYMIHALLVAGQNEYARQAIDYLLKHPWEGRPYPEGDTPGHLLWIVHKYWLFTRDETWLKQKLPAIRNLAQGILTMRSDGMRPIEVDLLGQKRTIPASPRVAQQLQQKAGKPSPFRLNYGTMDQGGLLYVNLVNLTGLWAAADMLREVAPEEADNLRYIHDDYLREFTGLLEALGYDFGYDQRGYCFAMWPAQIHRFVPKAKNYFAKTMFTSQTPTFTWKYLDMDYAHNFLLAGHRSAGCGVVRRYLNLYTFKTWRLLDEGGPSAEGYWAKLSNGKWAREIAIPHGWSLASLILLMRDALVYEDDGALVLLSGIPPEWFGAGKKLAYSLPTEYGIVRVYMECKEMNIVLVVDIAKTPPKGIYLALPETLGERRIRVTIGRNVILRTR